MFEALGLTPIEVYTIVGVVALFAICAAYVLRDNGGKLPPKRKREDEGLPLFLLLDGDDDGEM